MAHKNLILKHLALSWARHSRYKRHVGTKPEGDALLTHTIPGADILEGMADGTASAIYIMFLLSSFAMCMEKDTQSILVPSNFW